MSRDLLSTANLRSMASRGRLGILGLARCILDVQDWTPVDLANVLEDVIAGVRDDERRCFASDLARTGLPEEEVYLAIRVQLFRALDVVPRFEPISHLEFGVGEDAPRSDDEVSYTVAPLTHLSEPQQEELSRIRRLAPEGATIDPRQHVGEWGDERIRTCSVRVRVDWHGRTLTRVYAFPTPDDQEAP